MAARGNFRFGYRATPYEGGSRAYVLVQRDLGPTEIARLEEDLRRLSAGIGKATAALIEFDVPLSRSMSATLFDMSQKLELPMTLSVPSLAPSHQGSFGDDFLATEGHFFRIEPRSGAE